MLERVSTFLNPIDTPESIHAKLQHTTEPRARTIIDAERRLQISETYGSLARIIPVALRRFLPTEQQTETAGDEEITFPYNRPTYFETNSALNGIARSIGKTSAVQVDVFPLYKEPLYSRVTLFDSSAYPEIDTIYAQPEKVDLSRVLYPDQGRIIATQSLALLMRAPLDSEEQDAIHAHLVERSQNLAHPTRK
jgi:hypothetical protein